ncbi:MAG: GDSL-type esterase/lipase family protein [Bacteroides sp.]|nr:GDSL-type esterase/lipase family protein [Bacteroides sp.]MCM1380140.1 GDSL-type esterase/lipase family protein [Bacteroides sp.]MCM1445738.1 GDSL-type esterase/lipase family protein [Prevotella sp.]
MNFKKLLVAALCAASVTGAWAASHLGGAFRAHRYDSFYATPTKPGQIAFVGNSITHMHEWWEAFGNTHSIIGRGNSGGKVTEILPELENFIDSKPEKFFLMIGTNDISGGESAEVTAKRINAIVQRVKLESPETKIHVQTILPRGNANFPNTAWAACNALLHEMYDNDETVTLVDLTDAMIGMATEDVWSLDQLHPQPKGYATWTHIIENLVGHNSVYPAGADITADMQRTNGKGRSYDMRPAQFAFYKVQPNDVLLFGDELIHGGEWHELMGSANFKDRGSSWGYASYNLPQAKTIINIALRDQENKPAKIVINYGEGGTDLTNYRALITEAKTLAPNAKIYLMNLPPRVNADNDPTEFNASIANIAEETGCTLIDIYTPLAADRALNISDNFYLSGRGYVVVANAIAAAMPDVATEPISLEQYAEVTARRDNRKIIGDALTDVFMLEYGDQPGQIKEAHRAAILAAAADAASIINNPDLTAEQATAKRNAINAVILQSRTDLNYPTASTVDAPIWYTLTSARESKTAVSADGALVGGTKPGAVSYGSDVWQFINRGDDTYDIRNANGEYINPSAEFNTQMTVTTTVPDRGFSLSYSENGAGNFVIYTSNSQLNQTGNAQNYQVYNWYNPNAAVPDRADQGCAYALAEYDGLVFDPEKSPIQSGWYELKHIALDKYVTNLDETYRDTQVYSYPLQYQAAETTTPKNWLYIEVDGSNHYMQAQNGFYISEFTTNARTKSNRSITASSTDANVHNIQYWTNFTRSAHPELPDLIGRSSGANTPHAFRHVQPSELAAYDVWTVIINATNAAEEYYDTHVTLTSDGLRSIPTVYNNGTFFLAPGTVISEADLTCTAPEGVEQERTTPVVQIDADHKQIRVYYNGEPEGYIPPEEPATEPLAGGWYTMTLLSAKSSQDNRAALVESMNTAISSGINTAFAADTEYHQSINGGHYYYHVGVAKAAEVPSEAVTYFYVEQPSLTTMQIRSQNGHHILANGTAGRTATNISVSDLTNRGKATLPINIYTNNNLGCTAHDLIGSNSGVYTDWSIQAAKVDTYDVYTLNIVGETPADTIRDDVKVTLNTPDNKGLQSVYNGGSFFVTKGAEISASQVVVPEHAGNANPLVEVANNVITVDYSQVQMGIEELSTDYSPLPIEAFDLWGRRVRSPRHGLYIVNGQKVRL